MKKLVLIITALFSILSESHAQYNPMLGDTTEWCVVGTWIPVRSGLSQNRYVAVSDTTIGSFTYKKLWNDNSFPLPTNFAAMREDTATRRVYVYMYSSATESLLYDYNMNLGDSIYYAFPNSTSGIAYPGYYYVDSIGTATIRSGTRKYMRLQNPLNTVSENGRTYKPEFIESVGDIHDPLFLYTDPYSGYGMISMNCGISFDFALMKNTINNSKNHVNTCVAQYVAGTLDSDTCKVVYWGNIGETNKLAKISLFPNPTNGNEITIDINTYILPGNALINITDETGRIVYTSEKEPIGNSIKLNDVKLNSGIYTVSLYDEKKVFAKSKLIVTL